MKRYLGNVETKFAADSDGEAEAFDGTLKFQPGNSQPFGRSHMCFGHDERDIRKTTLVNRFHVGHCTVPFFTGVGEDV